MLFERLENSRQKCTAATNRKTSEPGRYAVVSCGDQAVILSRTRTLREEYFCYRHAQELLANLSQVLDKPVKKD